MKNIWMCAALAATGCAPAPSTEAAASASATTEPTTAPRPSAAPSPAPDKRVCTNLADAIAAPDLAGLLARFEEIAQGNGNNRAAGLPGYDASLDFVEAHLREGGWATRRQPFVIASWQQLGPGTLAITGPQGKVFRAGERAGRGHIGDHTPLWGSPPGEVTAPLRAFDLELGPGNHSTSGCEPDDFAGDDGRSRATGAVVLLQRGTCPFVDKLRHAQHAGAVGAVVLNQGDSAERQGLETGSLGGADGDHGVTIPALFVTAAVGRELAAKVDQGPVEVHLAVNTRWRADTTENLLAELPGSRPDEVLMAGAHLDSVTDGPGLNDNASGSAALLALARAAAGCASARTVRLAWWGAEELGLVGSKRYVESLEAAEKERLVGYVNLDMVGSPNHVFQLADGDGSRTGRPGPASSGALEAFFRQDFAATETPLEETPFLFRSDYAAFHRAGIGVASLCTGHDSVKTPQEQRRYGGTAGKAHDPCYHASCDGLANVNVGAALTVTRAVARAVERFGLRGEGLER